MLRHVKPKRFNNGKKTCGVRSRPSAPTRTPNLKLEQVCASTAVKTVGKQACAFELARIMQTNSYGPSHQQDEQDESVLPPPRTREKARSPSYFGTVTHARERVSGPKRNEAQPKGTWGGARNCKDRVTTALSQHHAEGLLRSMAIAELKGMPLNRHWTVLSERAGIDDANGAEFVGKLLVSLRRYACARGENFAAVWVREVGKRNGEHVHIAFHWPRGWKLGQLTRKWIGQAGGACSKGVSKIRPIGVSLTCAWTRPQLYRENLEKLGNYLTKGSDSEVAAELGLELLKPGGRIIGKRSGRTQNLGSNLFP